MTFYEIIGLIAAIIGIISFAWLIHEKYFPIKRISWRNAEKGAEQICIKMAQDDFDPSLIFGIGRGGSIMGSLISGCLGHRPLLVVDRKYVWSEKGRSEDLIFRVNIPNKYIQNVLLVAGEAHSGRTMNFYYDYFKNLKARRIKRAVLLFETGCPTHVEYKGMITKRKNLWLPWRFSNKYITSDMECGDRDECKPHIKLYLIRHAETTAGENIFVGKTDYPLTINGIEQALDAGRKFSSKQIARIYSSPSGRALMTAKIINHFLHDSDLIIDEGLQELDYGKWDGLNRTEIIKNYGKEYELWQIDPHKNCPPEAESPDDVAERLYNFLTKIQNTYYLANKGSEIIVVTHKTAIRLLLAKIELIPLKEYRKIYIPNCAVHTLSFSGKKWEVMEKINYH